MTTPPPPAGWYPDPHDPSQQRWWDGAAWTQFSTAWGTDAPPPAPAWTPVPPTSRTRARWRPTLTFWIVAAIAVLLALIGIGTGGLGGFLVIVALFGLGAGAWTLGTRRPGWLNLPRTRGAGGAALGISFAVLLVGALLVPHPQRVDVAADGTVNGEPAAVAEADAPTPAASTTLTSRPTPTPASKPTRTPTPTPTPVTTKQTVQTSEAIGFAQSSYDDPNVDVGTSVVVTAGVPGTKVITWEITLVDGVETGRTAVSEVVSVAPVDEVTAVGTRQPAPPPPAEPEPAPPAGGECHPNYAGACVPIADDVDCAGGSGNGPAYVAGPVQVVGPDIYDLDRDGDGIACD